MSEHIVYKVCAIRRGKDRKLKLVSATADQLPEPLVYEYKLGRVARFDQPFFVWAEMNTAKTAAYFLSEKVPMAAVVAGPAIGRVFEIHCVPEPWTLTPEKSARFWELVRSGQYDYWLAPLRPGGAEQMLAVEAMFMHKLEAIYRKSARLSPEKEEKLRRRLWREAMREVANED